MKTTVDNVLATLQADPTLATVKDFDKGSFFKPRNSFPFVNVGEIRREPIAETIGRGGKDSWIFTLKIQYGTKNYQGNVAYDELLDLANAIENICRINLFDGAFTRRCEIVLEETDSTLTKNSEILWVGETTIRGERRVTRPTR